jgi:uncharacterized damage-inducible protein DinB
MNISEALLPEFDHEIANTRKVLERLPEDKFAWKPHPKSFDLKKLATHVAHMPSWVNITMDTDVLDFAQQYSMPEPATRAEILALFDQGVKNARATIAKSGDELFFKPWTMRSGDKVFFTMPKIAVLRGFVMNHLIHHRAQLTVYLRLNDVPVPGMYGPSADEMPM